MDSARSTIVARVAELGLSLSELSLKVGKNHAYFQQFIKRGVPNRLPEEVRGRVAEILGLDELALRQPTATHVRFMWDREPQVPIRGAVGWIPVYGHAVGGKDGEFVLSGNQVSEVPAPPNLSHVRDAYAVYVVGDSMEPRYFAGETVFVNPRLPISRGSFVVAQISKGEEPAPRAYVKRFLSQDGKRLRLEQYNPKKILEFPASTVVAIHRIVMSSENR
jgi:phage repressor protein C with HTH and peptisase S24 domain